MTFGERVKLARERLCLSQEQFADLVGVHRVSVSRYETAASASPKSYARLERLAEVLGVNELWLAKGKGPMRRPQRKLRKAS